MGYDYAMVSFNLREHPPSQGLRRDRLRHRGGGGWNIPNKICSVTGWSVTQYYFNLCVSASVACPVFSGVVNPTCGRVRR